MPTVKEANQARQRRAWFIKSLIEMKEQQAIDRLNYLNQEIPGLKVKYEEYLKLYNLHIKPLMPDVDLYFEDLWEKRKLEHWLQGQAQHLEASLEASKQPHQAGKRSWTLPPQIEKLPYAGKSQVGKKPTKKAKALDEAEAKQLIAQIKALDPKIFDELLKKVR